jgi:hypothetical protein
MCIRKGRVVLPRYPLLTTHQPVLFVLCFHILTNPFSRNPFRFTSIQNPRGVGVSTLSLATRLLRALLRRVTRHFPFILNMLRTLLRSWRSFPRSRPLFSIVCRLFWQNTRGGGYRHPERLYGHWRWRFLLATRHSPLATRHSPLATRQFPGGGECASFRTAEIRSER